MQLSEIIFLLRSITQNYVLITNMKESLVLLNYPVNQITLTKRRFHVTFATLTWIYRRILSCLTSYRRGIALFVALLQRHNRKCCIDIVLNIVITSFLKFSDL